MNLVNKKLTLGITGPSVFSKEIQSMTEDFFEACPIYINQNAPDDLAYMVSIIDGLILGGGSDIFPGTYGSPITSRDGLSKFDILRDKRELFLINECIKQNKPILAICRGFQLIGVKFGFTLWADIGGNISHSPGGDEIKINLEAGEFAHYIKFTPGYKLGYFEDEMGVNSFHHQGIIYCKNQQNLNGFNVIATSETDMDDKKSNTIIEIMENEKNQILGVQFHPEADYMYGNEVSVKVLERFKEFLG